MRILVTGASGLIGLHVLPVLVAAGYDVHATSRTRPAQLPDEVTWHGCDLLDDRAAARLIGDVGARHLLHSAWCVTPGLVWWDPANLDWCGATLRLVRQFTDAGGKRALLVGTCAEYEWSGGTCDEATTPLRPATLYGQAKGSCRAMIEAYAAAAGLSVAWVRVFNMFGPHEDTRRLVAAAITSLLRGERFACTDGLQRRDFLHVTDLARALHAVLASGVIGAVNVGSGETVTIRSLLEEIGRQAGASAHIDFGSRPRPMNEPEELLPNLTRLHGEVGWSRCMSLQTGIAQTLAWWRDRAERLRKKQ